MRGCQSVGREAMAKAVLRPARELGCLAHTRQLSPYPLHRDNRALQFAVGPKPCCEIWRDWNNSTACAFCFGCFYFDMPSRLIYFVPMEPLNLSVSQSRKRTYREHW